METIGECIAKRQTFGYVWELLNPQGEYRNDDIYRTSMSYWNSLPLQRQRQIYWALQQQKKRGEPIKAHPYYAIKDCVPLPTNWNGRSGIIDMMKTYKMVCARFKPTAKYGVYTLFEANLFEMDDIKPMNY